MGDFCSGAYTRFMPLWTGQPLAYPTVQKTGAAAINGVQIGPGATQLTRMPLSASSCARPAVKLAIAPFVVAYASSSGDGCLELMEAVLTMALPVSGVAKPPLPGRTCRR